MEEQPKRQFTGFFIPVEVLDDPRLGATEKLLLAEIDALRGEDNEGCWASNAFLAKRVGVSASRAAHIITKLREMGYVETVSFNGRQRRLRAILNRSKAALLDVAQLPSGNQQGSIAGNSKKDSKRDSREISLARAERVYEVYPRKVGRPTALLEIAKAIEKHSFEKVMAATKQFAAMRPDKHDPYTPHPATFYHQERYMDDPASWKPKPQRGAQPQRSAPISMRNKRINALNQRKVALMRTTRSEDRDRELEEIRIELEAL